MPLITRKQVIPGDVIASGDYRYGSYIEKRGSDYVFGREFSPATHDLSSKFKVGDLLLCKIEAFDRSRDPQISIRGPGLGKVPEGEIVKISPTKVPRLIGRKGYMVNMISAQTGCELKVGQNGLVVVSGPPEGILKAANAIRMIEEEAHLADLTTKVQNYLGAEAQGGE